MFCLTAIWTGLHGIVIALQIFVMEPLKCIWYLQYGWVQPTTEDQQLKLDQIKQEQQLSTQKLDKIKQDKQPSIRKLDQIKAEPEQNSTDKHDM